jgi:hypothetical protein
LVASISLLSGLMSVTAKAATEKGSGPAIVNVVTFTVPPRGGPAFRQQGKQPNLAQVPGCIGFDVRHRGEPAR